VALEEGLRRFAGGFARQKIDRIDWDGRIVYR